MFLLQPGQLQPRRHPREVLREVRIRERHPGFERVGHAHAVVLDHQVVREEHRRIGPQDPREVVPGPSALEHLAKEARWGRGVPQLLANQRRVKLVLLRLGQDQTPPEMRLGGRKILSADESFELELERELLVGYRKPPDQRRNQLVPDDRRHSLEPAGRLVRRVGIISGKGLVAPLPAQHHHHFALGPFAEVVGRDRGAIRIGFVDER